MNSFLINPFEEIGVTHNEGLDYIVANLSSSTAPKVDEIIRLAAQFACRQIRPNNVFSKSELISMMSVVSYSIIHLNEIKSVYQDATLNQQQIVFLERMLSVNPYIKIDEQNQRFRLIESEIFAYPMPYKEKELLLIASAVGKHSGEYWNTQFNDPASPWQVWFPDPNDPGTPLGKKKWATEDAKGAVAGAIGGAVGGLPGGPGGVLIGAGLGAVGGAIGSSLVSLIFD